MIRKSTEQEIDDTVAEYTRVKTESIKPIKGDSEKRESTVDAAVIGFIKRNRIVGKTMAEIDDLVYHARRLKGTELIGTGDQFKVWCIENGRSVPDTELVLFMNRDPFEAGQHIRINIPNDPFMWRNWCTYNAGKGRRRV